MSDDLRHRSAPLDDDYLLWESGVWGQSSRQDARDTPLPVSGAAAGFAAGRAGAAAVASALEAPEAIQVRGVVHKVTLEVLQETTATVTARPATGAKAQPVALPPGAGRAGSALKSFFPRTYSGIFYPLIADAQRDWYLHALAHEKPSRWIEVRMWLLIAANAIRMVAEWIVRRRG
jgi:hypothetical protein